MRPASLGSRGRHGRARSAVIVLIGVVAGCSDPDGGAAASATGPAPGTVAMAARLREMARTADPRANEFINRARVRAYSQMRPPPEPRAIALQQGIVAQDLLRSGDPAAAIERFLLLRAMLEETGVQPTPQFHETLDEFLAVSYLWLAMKEGCPEAGREGPCLMSLPPGARSGGTAARMAIQWYEGLLRPAPGDLRNRWLLNLAHMAAGQWPDSVPERWRIPAGALADDHDPGRFVDAAPRLGIDVLSNAGGGIVEDFDRDGWLDLMVSSRGLLDQMRYFRNDGSGGFQDRTVEAGLSGLVGGLNMVHADYDNDGHVDVLVLRGGWLPRGYPNSLLRNNGDGTFEDVTEPAGLLSQHPTQTAAWADYDGDGWLDLFIGNESDRSADPPRVHPSELYRNDRDGTFTEVAFEVGVAVDGFVKGVVWGDIDNDDRPDLFISRFQEPNKLFHNEGPGPDGRFRFRDVTAEAGVSEPIASFPAWFWDYDNDGWLDLFVSGYLAESAHVAAEYLGLPHEAELPRLYRNQGDGTFGDVTSSTGVDRILYAMGSNFGDLDNDGWLDFFIGTGDPQFRQLMPNRVFRSDGGRRFQEVTMSGGFGALAKGHAVSFADVDHDGDQDIHLVLGGAYEGDVSPNALYLNPGHGNRWLKLELVGATSNRHAVGARIRVAVATPDGPREIHRVVGAGGSFGANPFRSEIGLGRASEILEVEVRWPASGGTDLYTGLVLDRLYRLREGDPEPEPVPLTPVEHGS